MSERYYCTVLMTNPETTIETIRWEDGRSLLKEVDDFKLLEISDMPDDKETYEEDVKVTLDWAFDFYGEKFETYKDLLLYVFNHIEKKFGGGQNHVFMHYKEDPSGNPFLVLTSNEHNEDGAYTLLGLVEVLDDLGVFERVGLKLV